MYVLLVHSQIIPNIITSKYTHIMWCGYIRQTFMTVAVLL